MSLLNRNPENTNLLQPTKFLLTFARLPATQYFCQEVNLPGVTLGTVDRATPFLDMYSPGTKLKYDDLDITFVVDEELQSWKDMYNWFTSIADPNLNEATGLYDVNYTGAYRGYPFKDGGRVAKAGGGPLSIDDPMISRIAAGIARVESSGYSDPYSIVGKKAKNRNDYPYGKYQIMGSNIPEWGKAAGYPNLTIEQFRRRFGRLPSVNSCFELSEDEFYHLLDNRLYDDVFDLIGDM